MKPLPPGLPEQTAAETVDAIVTASKRETAFPLRTEFLQIGEPGAVVPGPMHLLVRASDHRGLLLYLLLATKASSKPFDAALPSPAWARALGIALPASNTARSTVSKAWLRLERHSLIRRERKDRKADVFLLREDGSGAEYEPPGEVRDRYFQVPLDLWTSGPTNGCRWFEVLTLPELAVLLIARSLSDDFYLPPERGPEWYGVSADTIHRGLEGLRHKALLETEEKWKPAPLSAIGYTTDHRHTLREPFGPHGFSNLTGPKPESRSRKKLRRSSDV